MRLAILAPDTTVYAIVNHCAPTKMLFTSPALQPIRVAALLMLALPAGCAVAPQPSPTRFEVSQEAVAVGLPPPGAMQGQPPVVEPVRSDEAQSSPVDLPQPIAAGDPLKAAQPAAPSATPPVVPVKKPIAARTAPPAVKTLAKPSPVPAQRRENDSGTVQAKEPAAPPPLDVASLKQRLKDTKAIGVFTKIALKNQVDDLMNQFREFYRGQLKTSLAALRQSYEMLIMKVLALLQDDDPSLAHTIAASREAIWGILANRDKFNSLQ